MDKVPIPRSQPRPLPLYDRRGIRRKADEAVDLISELEPTTYTERHLYTDRVFHI